jgi:transposase-like protein
MSDFSPEPGLSALTVAVAVHCPYCGEPIEVVVDVSVGDQSYVEDCHVCCRPISISYRAAGGELEDISVQAENE